MASKPKQLFYITHIDNINSILSKGILSHQYIEENNIPFTPIYDAGIVSNRKERLTPSGRNLWHYANLYFQARNPMLYRVVSEKSAQNIAVVGVVFNVISQRDVFVSDGNAASHASNILPASEHLKVLRDLKNILNYEWWKDEDGSKRKIMAECLIPERVTPDCIKAIYVATPETAKKIKSNLSVDVPVIPEPKVFFENSFVARISDNIVLMRGDLFFSRLHTLTVSVNVVGVMGKGLASRAKYQFPDVYVLYQDLCRKKILRMGKPYIYKREASFDVQLADDPATLKNGNGASWFLLFPTKNHWRENGDFTGIEQGMRWLSENYKSEGIKSLALPALGCGLGNLAWKDVGPMMCKYLSKFDIPVHIYLPAEQDIPAEYLERDYLLSLS
jgi:hypothetical protein